MAINKNDYLDVDGNYDLKKALVDELIDGVNDDGPIVELGTFNDETELITHVVMNQLPTGHYTFFMDGFPFFMLLEQGSTYYEGTLHSSDAFVNYFKVSIYGEIIELKTIDLRGQMPISGGVLENYREKLTTVSASSGIINLSLGNVFQHTPSASMAYAINNAVNGQAHSFTLIVNMGSTVRTLYFPASVKWQGGEIPDMTTASKTYILTFMSVNGGTTWLGMFGGDF